jgi:hypothetical protein
LIENLGEKLLSLPNGSTTLITYQEGKFYPFNEAFFGELYNSFFIYPNSLFGTKIGTSKGKKLMLSLGISVIKIMRRLHLLRVSLNMLLREVRDLIFYLTYIFHNFLCCLNMHQEMIWNYMKISFH